MSAPPVLRGSAVVKEFARGRRPTPALAGVDFAVYPGQIAGILGPDGAGKTTLLRLLAGLLRPTGGTLEVAGFDPARQPREVQSRIGYMPQKFGLYEDLTVRENLRLFAELRAVPAAGQAARFEELLHLTALERFTDRLAGRLSGGMKQKLALACTLVAAPPVALLDEPTVGVDPLSRRELWQILRQLTAAGNLTVLVSTAYLDEAAYCAQFLLLCDGRQLAAGTPDTIAARAAGLCYEITAPEGEKAHRVQLALNHRPGTVHAAICGRRIHWVTTAAPGDPPWPCQAVAPTFTDGFLLELKRRLAPDDAHAAPPTAWPPSAATLLPTAETETETVVEVRNLVRRFGAFVAVDRVGFEVRRGEIFGLLGPNGAGKSTTFRMLCGLLPADEGTLQVAGHDLRHAAAAARRNLGYVAQKFSLYGDLTALENLRFFAGAYGLSGRRRAERIAWALDRFQLHHYRQTAAGLLPGGYKQRLSMACALLHEPRILFLDEPTSGADPLARLEFWQRINEVADSGVTIIITTHFLDEAEYCDRMVIMMDGRILAGGTPDQIRAAALTAEQPRPTLEDAFIAITAQYRAAGGRV